MHGSLVVGDPPEWGRWFWDGHEEVPGCRDSRDLSPNRKSSTVPVQPPVSIRRSLTASIAAVLALGVALPAAANPTTATVEVTGGSLSISAPADAGSLGTTANTVQGTTISGPLGQVQVDDARSAAAGSGWVASVISTAFTPPSGPTIPASAVGYTVGGIVQVGTATYTANDPADLTGASPAVTATGITGDNSATWTPTINVAVPGGMAAGVYAATITHSVL